MTAVAAAPSVLIPPMRGDMRTYVPIGGGTVHRFSGEAIGTGWRLSVVLTDEGQLDAARTCMMRGLAMVVAQMSQWEPASELSRFNAAPAGTGMTLSPGFIRVLDCALVLARESDGAFDPALGELSEAWGFGAGAASGRPPEPGMRRTGWRALNFDPATGRIVQPGGISLDLSGIAKGFAVDLVSALLSREGLGHHLVEIGGELRGSGVKPDGQPWWVDIEDAPGSPGEPARIALSGWAVATSGDWHRRRECAGESWSHTLSPATGAPVKNGNRAASVLHRDCMQADGLATLLMVLDGDAAIAFADGRGLAARITDARGTVRASTAWRAME